MYIITIRSNYNEVHSKKVYNFLMIICKLDDLIWQHRANAKEIAKVTGISTNTLSRWRNNKTGAYEAKNISLICKYFNCKVSDLLEYVPD